MSYPHCSRDADGSLLVAWAGWDYLQQATALATYYVDMKDNEGWAPERLKLLLAGIQELVPWLKQWHNEYDPEHATRMGDYFASFVIDEDARPRLHPGRLTGVEADRDRTEPEETGTPRVNSP